MHSVRARLIVNARFGKKFVFCRYSTLQGQAKPVDKEREKREAAKLALQSIKDIGNIFGSSSEDAVQSIDTKPIYDNPALFSKLNLLHQGQVVKELQEKFDGKWSKLTQAEKKLAYYIYYGNWGLRERFSNWDSMTPPFDLPFHVPSRIKTSHPTLSTIISKENPPVILSQTPVRAKDFDVKRVDGFSKFFIYLTIFISLLAIYRDKNIGEEGKPTEIIIEDPHERDRLKKLQEESEENKKNPDKKGKKWYYLWLK